MRRFFKAKQWGSTHLATLSNGCTRCAQAYIISRDGATRLLSKGALPFVHNIDIHISHVSNERRSEGRPLGCFWAEPPIVWEDPGSEGDGLADAAKADG